MPEQAKTVVRVFEQFASGFGLGWDCQILNRIVYIHLRTVALSAGVRPLFEKSFNANSTGVWFCGTERK